MRESAAAGRMCDGAMSARPLEPVLPSLHRCPTCFPARRLGECAQAVGMHREQLAGAGRRGSGRGPECAQACAPVPLSRAAGRCGRVAAQSLPPARLLIHPCRVRMYALYVFLECAHAHCMCPHCGRGEVASDKYVHVHVPCPCPCPYPCVSECGSHCETHARNTCMPCIRPPPCRLLAHARAHT